MKGRISAPPKTKPSQSPSQWTGFVYDFSDKRPSEKVKIIRNLYGYSYLEKKKLSSKDKGARTKTYPRKIKGVLSQASAWRKVGRNIIAVPARDRSTVESFFERNRVKYQITTFETPPTPVPLGSSFHIDRELSGKASQSSMSAPHQGMMTTQEVNALKAPSVSAFESDPRKLSASVAKELQSALDDSKELGKDFRKKAGDSANRLIAMAERADIPEAQRVKLAEAANLIFRALYELSSGPLRADDKASYLNWIRRAVEIIG